MQRLIYKLDKAYWSVRYAIQRVYRGYDDRDVFEFFSNFLNRNVKILKEYKKYNAGYPGDLTETEWDNILQEIIDCFENADEDAAAEKLYGGFDKTVNNWSIEKQDKVDAFAEQNKNRGFDLLKERFFSLWY